MLMLQIAILDGQGVASCSGFLFNYTFWPASSLTCFEAFKADEGFAKYQGWKAEIIEMNIPRNALLSAWVLFTILAASRIALENSRTRFADSDGSCPSSTTSPNPSGCLGDMIPAETM